MFEEELISEVQKFPCIYNKMEKGYKNKIIREKAWGTIAASLGVNVEQCKSRWRTLKDRFVKDFNKVGASGSEATPEKSPWKFTAQMSFMKDYVSPWPTSVLTLMWRWRKLSGRQMSRRKFFSLRTL